MTEEFCCPCCGFPTLSERSSYEICIICWWEDDGQDDASADEVWGGPNGKYSLSAARKNFKDHGHMYGRGKGIEVVEQPSKSRRALLDYVQALASGSTPLDKEVLAALIDAANRRHDR